MKKNNLFKIKYLAILLLGLTSCQNDTNDSTDEILADKIAVNTMSPEMAMVRDYVMPNAVIAHRGSTFWMPEETEAAFRWARNIGADYLEIDIQRTKDGVLLALHDDNLKRTTDISSVFPLKQDNYLYDLTFEELLKLDAGSWFNYANPTQARPSFVNQGISTLEDVIQIAQGKRIVRNADGTRKYTKNAVTGKFTFFYENDPADNGNRPGVYIESKEPWMFTGIESDIYNELDRLNWNVATKPVASNTPFFLNNKVNTGNTNGKVILQTFSNQSLLNIEKVFKGKVPTCLLLWSGDAFLTNSDSPENYADAINFAIDHKAHFTGPSIAGKPNNYADILKPWQAHLTHRSGLKIHAYSFDTREQMEKYFGLYFGKDSSGKLIESPLTDAMFTNRSEITIDFYKSVGARADNITGNNISPKEVLNQLGY